LKVIAVLLIVILFCSIIIPAEAKSNSKKSAQIQNESHTVKNSNPDVLYDWYVSGGGPEIRTEDQYWGFCKVGVETVVSKLYSNGFVRNNPDGSFYPADGFGYNFVFGLAGDPSKCRNFTVCPIISKNIMPESTQLCEPKKLKALSKKASKNGKIWSSSGDAEISADENASSHYISLRVNAERWGCHFPKNLPRVCGWTNISATGSFAPNVIRPIVDVDISQEHLNDIDGYKSGNLDKTYYLWDAINIVHNPQYQWKKDRAGTLSVKVTKQYDLKLEKEFQCESAQCDHTLVHSGFEPWPKTYEYGGGATIYNATKDDQVRKHLLIYKIELLNLGRLIHSSQNKTDVLVVAYEPVYQNYSYLVLKDEYWWSWGNRQAIALEYKGSIGGGPDDTPGVHQGRRSKINSYNYSGYAFDPILPKQLNQTFLWDQASTINLTQKCSDSEIDSVSFETKNSKTAMFVKAGFGKIAFSWPIVKTMLEKRYLNATIENTLQSASFAGYELKNLTKYSYQYPDVKFNNPVKVLTYHSDGSRTDFPLSVKLVPDISKGSLYLHDYVCKKVLHDTANSEFADIVVDDMYGRENIANGTGYVNMKTQLTSTWFAPFYTILVNDTFELPIVEGYKALSPYEITITVGKQTRKIQRVVNFLSPFVHVVNLDSDNLLNVTESFGFVQINPDKKFGEIIKVRINGKELGADCTSGCTTTIYPNEDLDIEAWNVWGGRVSYHLPKPAPLPTKDQVNLDLAFVAIIMAVAGLILWRFASKP
jgi:hypothetical protein